MQLKAVSWLLFLTIAVCGWTEVAARTLVTRPPLPSPSPSPKPVTGHINRNLMPGFLAVHNAERVRVGVPKLSWSDSLAAYAQHYADFLRVNASCAITPHDAAAPGYMPYGENDAWNTGVRNAVQVAKMWAAEVANFDHTTRDCIAGKTCGTYKQMVWRTTEFIGCGVTTCANHAHHLQSRQVWVCNYSPAGNVVGQPAY